MTDEDLSVKTEATLLPEIPFFESDYEPIPGTESIWIDKRINKKAITAFVRYWTRQGIRVEMIGTSTRSDVHKISEEIGSLSKEFIQSRLRSVDFAHKWNATAIKFQQKLLESEPLGPGITGVVTIPDHTDIVWFNTCELNRAEQESNTN